MAKVFNTTAVCVPEEHYMVNIDGRLKEIKELVDAGKYFTINRARQYGKTTTLLALSQYLQNDYNVVLMDFQTFGSEDFNSEHNFSLSFANSFLESFECNSSVITEKLQITMEKLEKSSSSERFTLRPLFQGLRAICAVSEKPVVLMIDEVDSATNNQVFLDFLAQLRAQYIKRFQQPAFKSVILAGVYDVRNLKQKIRPEEDHKFNSPWNTREGNEENESKLSFDDCSWDHREFTPYDIAADFKIDMSFSRKGISGMLEEYEGDYHIGMEIDLIAGLLYDYTSGYPFLVSRLCQLLDEDVSIKGECGSKKKAWTKQGFHEAVRMILSEKNTLFGSLIGKLEDYPKLNAMLRTLLFTGRTFSYSADESIIDMAAMFGFIKNQNNNVVIANRIFETRLYNYYLSEDEMQAKDIYRASLQEKNQFVVNGHLNMRRILEKFVIHFSEIYGSSSEKFLEDEGRKYFLLYLRPIINGTGNYYIEARTRDLHRTDVIVDYRGVQYIIEMKIWHGEEYNHRGEKQLIAYLDDYQINRGYMLSFNFNKTKAIGVHEIIIGEKEIVEAVV